MSGDMRLPVELLYGVMKQLGSHVHGRAFLFQAMQVNRTWHEQACRVLWRAPPVSALASPELSEYQRKKYATYIRRLYFAYYEDTILHWTFRNLRFPQLRYIDIDHTLAEYVPLGMYIQKNLRHLKFRGGTEVEYVVDLMATGCQKLKSVDLGFLERCPARERLVRLFDDKSLKSVCIFGAEMESLDVDLLAYLARYNSLEKLKLWATLDARDFIDTFYYTANEYLFRNIQYINLNQIDVSSIPLLVRSVKPPHDLFQLRLALEGDSVDPFQYISELKSLQVLCIEYRGQVQWSNTDILALRGLENLVKLRILRSRSVQSMIDCPQLTDQDFASVFETKPSLRKLIFEVRNNLTVEAWVSLGKYCPQLKSCKLRGVYDFHRFRPRDEGQNDRPHFPQLARLTLTRLVPPSGE